MDEPDLAPARHVSALSALARINWLSASDGIVWRAIAPLLSRERSVRLLDVASGAGDVPIRLWRRARKAGYRLEIVGADISATARDFARARAQQCGAEVSFISLDALQDPLPGGFDVVTSSLFLHHLEECDAVRLLAKMGAAAGRMALVNDLRRCRSGYWAAWLGARILTSSNVVHVDGPRSVEGAFTLDEIRRLADQAGWAGATLARRWPWRFLLQWRKTS